MKRTISQRPRCIPPLQPRKSGPAKTGVSLMELLVVVSIMVLLSATLFRIMSSISSSFSHARNRLDILMTTRIILSAVRNDLRNAIEKPQAQVNDAQHIVYIPLRDPLNNKDKVSIYLFDETARRLYRGTKPEMSSPDPDLSQFRTFMFDDGQILKFEFDSSYRDADAFAESELSLNSKVWFKVTMKILYTEKYKSLSDSQRESIAKDPNDPRVKTFFMMITPRRVNWLLQATQ
jgi:hypothetical protein